MELSYFAPEMGLAGNLLYPNDIVQTSQQFYYEYSTDYLFAPPAPGTTQNSTIYDPISSTSNAANHLAPVSGSQVGLYPPPIYAANFQPNSIEGVPLESSVFLSPQTSASSSAAQSPLAEIQQNELFDLSLDEIFDVDVDDILNNDLIADELLDVLNNVESGDFLNQLEVASHNFDSGSSFSSGSSVTSSPKRKFSTDSSDCSSLDSFDTCSTASSSGNKKAKRTRPFKANKQERASRKKDQNKKAASRYRNKKKNEMQSSEQTMEELESHRDSLSEQVKKLQTEFNVILPLAKAAFTFDPIRREHLNQLISRINTLL